jgi:hypothetical protein
MTLASDNSTELFSGASDFTIKVLDVVAVLFIL